MAIVSIDGKNLVVTMTGINKVAALKSRIDVPLAHVRGATEDPGIVHESKGLRAPGTHVPGIITAGTFHQHGERIFWDVTDGSRAIVIEFVDEDFARLVITVEDPRASVELVNRAIRAGGRVE